MKNALGFEEAVSGGIGAAIANGMVSGLFSNVAGLDSALNAAAAAETSHSLNIGIPQAFSVFIDTFIVCSCTAFIILLGDLHVFAEANLDGTLLTQRSLALHFGGWAEYVFAIMLLMFSFSSFIYNYYLGENAISYFTNRASIVNFYKVLVVSLLMFGVLPQTATEIFFFSDPLMGLLALINLFATIKLYPVFKKLFVDYKRQMGMNLFYQVTSLNTWV